uniref:Uncharacterized protein n=1 Tax=Fundulus heteroclitus TaxID=8078 RepID=A0A3Q2QTF2_FUNHE
MGLSSSLESLLLPLWISWICAGLAAAELVHEGLFSLCILICRVFSVPGDVAMLKSTLLSPEVSDFTTVPFSITWYSKKTGQEMRNETGQVLVFRETLWFLNTTMDDAGEYLTVLRTPSQCYMQSTKLVVELPVAGECGRPQKVEQRLTEGVADTLTCPLSDYIDTLDSYGISSSVSWYKVSSLKFLSKINRNTEKQWAITRMNFTKRCRVFVQGAGMPFVDVVWLVRNKLIRTTQPSDRIYISEQRSWTQDDPKGVWLERLLLFSELRREDFYLNYTCRAYSSQGILHGYFTLLPTVPVCIMILLNPHKTYQSFTVAILVILKFYSFANVITNNNYCVLTVPDGKHYDAYVSVSQSAMLSLDGVACFALQILPQELEQKYGYYLYIRGRDDFPGEGQEHSSVETVQFREDQNQLLYEQKVGLHDALMQNDPKVILVEVGKDQFFSLGFFLTCMS